MAARIASFLEAAGDARVFLAEGEIGPNQDLLGKAREAQTAEVILVLFSHHCALPPGTRSQWERVLVEEPKANGVRVGFVQCDDWTPPRTLQPQFDCRGLAPSGLRKLKRWVRHRAATWHPPEGVGLAGAPAELDDIGSAVADRPGVQSTGSAALAYAFVRAYAEDFDEVFRLECAGRTPAAVAGDLGVQIGLGLESDLPGNLEKLREFCSARRFLVLLEDPEGDHAGLFLRGKLFHADGCRIGAGGAPMRRIPPRHPGQIRAPGRRLAGVVPLGPDRPARRPRPEPHRRIVRVAAGMARLGRCPWRP